MRSGDSPTPTPGLRPVSLTLVVVSSGGACLQLWAGVPAAFVRQLTTEEIAKIKQGAVETFEVCHPDPQPPHPQPLPRPSRYVIPAPEAPNI